MKVFRIFGRNIRDSFKSVFRNLSLSMASIMCITITLVVVSLAIILTYNVNNFTKEVEKDVSIVVFLDSSITDEGIDDVSDELDKIKRKMSISHSLLKVNQKNPCFFSDYGIK